MNTDWIDGIIKMCILNVLIQIIFFRLNDDKNSIVKIIIASIITSIFGVLIKLYLNDNIFMVIISSMLFQIILERILIKDKKKSIIVSSIMANAFVYIIFFMALIIESIIKNILSIKYQTVDIILTLLIEILIIVFLYSINRVKYGIGYLKNKIGNDYLCIVMLNISAMVIFSYCLFGGLDKYFFDNMFFVFLVMAGIMGIMTQKTLTLYYKQKLLAKNIEDYKSEIALKDAQIKSLSDEKYKISKLNHEFYNRQRALIHKVEEITSMNTEIADELDLSKQINDLTKEYTDKAQEIKTLDKLPTTGIVEIDDMFKYMQSECDSKKIQFNLKINGNIYHMINNKIPQSRLVTLIGDHLRDAIIAIDFSNNTFKSILAVLGENNGVYEFCVFDTGIEFKIDTLLNLGLKPATTHKDSGGTGIGFMTTFEIMKETKASLIIDEMREMSNTDYTKSVTIRFDGKNEYRIKSYRNDEIKKKMKDNRIIIENKKGSSTQWN